MDFPSSKELRYTIIAVQLQNHIMAYSSLKVYTALFLDGRISREHFEFLVNDVEADLRRRNVDLEERVASPVAEPPSGQGDSADSE